MSPRTNISDDAVDRRWRTMLLKSSEGAFWVAIAILLIALMDGAVFSLGGGLIGVPALFFIVLMFPLANAAARTIRRRRAIAVLGYLHQAVGLNQPMHRILLAAAGGESDAVAQRLRSLHRSLEGGAPLASALAQTVPEMPARAVGLIFFAERLGRLDETLAQLIREEVGESRQLHINRTFTRWYAPTLVLIAGVIILMCATFVFPKFLDILRDFKVAVPPLVNFTINTAAWLQYLLPVLAAILIIVLGLELQAFFNRRRPGNASRLLGRIAWYIPFTRALQTDRTLADACGVVGDALSVGRPMDVALSEAAAQLEMNEHMRKRFQSWAQGVAGGMAPADAARKAKMPSFLVGMLSTASSAPDQGVIFGFLMRYYRSRFRRRQALAEGAVVPVLAMTMGVVVATIALSLFLPMTQIIDRMCALYGAW